VFGLGTNCFYLILGEKYEPEEFVTEQYKTRMKLIIKSVTAEDYGTYKCLSRNALGDTDGTIKIYRKFQNSINTDGYLLTILFNILD